MKQSSQKAKNLMQPYVFLFKEGKSIQDNYLDYSLLLLKVTVADVFSSPNRPPNVPFLPFGQVIKTKLN